MSGRRLITNLKGLFTPDPETPWGTRTVPDAALAIQDNRIAWMGPRNEIPQAWQGAESIDGKGRWATPGFVDPHTHLLFGGDRSQEFNRRLHGVSYAELAAAGGGIRETMRATRLATVAELVAIGETRLAKLARKGVVHIEAKT
ncbi:MAG: hypothetical protein WAT51_09680, partial [Holophaga sp.]